MLASRLRTITPVQDIKSDHSLMHRDFEPYYVWVGDSWSKIDYERPAEPG
ncbi:hypothetical protein [Saccharopolyspora spinosa]|nr:hypothetical protein [Saccharopolyspora spinosa]